MVTVLIWVAVALVALALAGNLAMDVVEAAWPTPPLEVDEPKGRPEPVAVKARDRKPRRRREGVSPLYGMEDI